VICSVNTDCDIEGLEYRVLNFYYNYEDIKMDTSNRFVFPQRENLERLRDFYAEINTGGSFDPVMKEGEGVWCAEVHCSRGEVFEKAGMTLVELTGGEVDGGSADISLVQTLAWPKNPNVPGLIIMASTSKMEGMDAIITFYADLIIQNAVPQQEDKDVFTDALRVACEKHGQSLEEYQAFLAGRGMLGGCAAECGILYFFEKSDADLLESLFLGAMEAYKKIISGSKTEPTEDDFVKMQDSRKKIQTWMTTEDYGYKVSRQNNIPEEVIAAYGFPPLDKK